MGRKPRVEQNHIHAAQRHGRAGGFDAIQIAVREGAGIDTKHAAGIAGGEQQVHAAGHGQERIDVAAQGITGRPGGGFILRLADLIVGGLFGRGAEVCQFLLEDVRGGHGQESAGAAGAIHDAFAGLRVEHLHRHFGHVERRGVAALAAVHHAAGDRTEVRTVITMKDGKKVPVAYRMLPKDGGWRVYDVLIENISLVKNYRTQFQDILNSASPDQLIERVRVKAQEVRQQDAK